MSELKVTDPLYFRSLFDSKQDSESCNLGIMGGTFDPIHFGHLLCAQLAKEELSLDAVLFIPVGVSAFKTDKRTASGIDRFNMCALATADNPSFFVSSLEIEKDGISYTVDTLKFLKRHLPNNVKLTFITGLDTCLSLDKWSSPDELAQLAEFCCVYRPGFDIDRSELGDMNIDKFKIAVIDDIGIDISSTQIRKRIKDGKSVRYLCPLSVCEYIEQKGLYLDV